MRRVLFNRYEIDDQNHDFLVSKAYFNAALEEHVLSELFKDKINLNNNTPTRSTVYVDEDEESLDYYSMIVLTTHEEFLNSRLVQRNVELLYYPNIGISTKSLKLNLYTLSLVDCRIEIDLDKIFYNVKNRLKKKKIDFSVSNDFENKNLSRYYNEQRILNLVDTAKMEICVKNRATFDIAWEIISILENDFFRSVELADIKS